jgi:hypothetical protein
LELAVVVEILVRVGKVLIHLFPVQILQPLPLLAAVEADQFNRGFKALLVALVVVATQIPLYLELPVKVMRVETKIALVTVVRAVVARVQLAVILRPPILAETAV